MRPYLRVRKVADEGIDLVAWKNRPVDVLLDDRRVWTFWTFRDTQSAAGPSVGPVRRVAWPRPLRRHLSGLSRVTLRDSATEAVFFERELAFGDGRERIRVRNKSGVDLGIDKSGRLVPTFAGRSERDIDALLDATEAVLEALRATGVEPFLAYGTLLGAVREGTVLGHDSDADLGYVSRHTDPVDVVRESFQVQRQLVRRGWRISRYSGSAFKISVTEADVTRGLDVFGGFFDSGRLYLMGEIGTPFEPDWIRPLGTATLGGRPMPVPARPDKLLEATYGPGWKVPDPAFKFATPERTVRALEDWFRGSQPNFRYWDRRAAIMSGKPLRAPSALAKRARTVAEGLGAEVLDVGAGRGSDSVWLARKGLRVTAYDYVTRGLEVAQGRAEALSLDLEVRHLNLTDTRSVLAEGARLARQPRPRVVLARHVLDATSGVGRESLARLCEMALRGTGGRLLAECYVPQKDGNPDWMVGRLDLDAMTTLLRDAGASRVSVKELPGPAQPTVRLVGVW